MGHTIQKLAEVKLDEKPIFEKRFCIELCEKVHLHYKNLRIVLMMDDFIKLAQGFSDAVDRWKKRGCPGTGVGQHLELCRREIDIVEGNNDIQINLNDNLYLHNQDKVFAMGTDFREEKYIHLKIRDYRIELSLSEFRKVADAVKEADRKLEDSSLTASI